MQSLWLNSCTYQVDWSKRPSCWGFMRVLNWNKTKAHGRMPQHTPYRTDTLRDVHWTEHWAMSIIILGLYHADDAVRQRSSALLFEDDCRTWTDVVCLHFSTMSANGGPSANIFNGLHHPTNRSYMVLERESSVSLKYKPDTCTVSVAVFAIKILR